MKLIIVSAVILSLSSTLVANPLDILFNLDILPPEDGLGSAKPDFSIGSPEYPKGQAASVLINGLLEGGIDSGTVGGETYLCPEMEGLYSDLFDCSSYYNCTDGFSIRMKCPEKLAFDNNTNTCVEREKVELCKELLKDSDYNCTFNGLHIYPKDCSKYYVCVKDKAFVGTCQAGKYFDNALRLCIPKAQALCLFEAKIVGKPIMQEIANSTTADETEATTSQPATAAAANVNQTESNNYS